MLNIFMLCREDPVAAAQSLAALVPGVVLGHIGRVVMQVAEENDALRNLAEEAGCDLLVGSNSIRLFAEARALRSGWWLLMREGQIPGDGWSEEAMRHARFRSSTAVALPERGVWRIAGARLACMFGRVSTRRHMLFLPEDQAATLRGAELGCTTRPTILRTRFSS